MENSQPLVSNYVRTFVEKDGGSLRFVPKVDDDGRMYWELRGVFPDGSDVAVLLSHSGKKRIFKSSDAVIAYWRELYPEAREVTIPILPVDSK